MIRRTKAIIAHQLPKKDERVVFCKPTDLQVSLSAAVSNEMLQNHCVHCF